MPRSAVAARPAAHTEGGIAIATTVAPTNAPARSSRRSPARRSLRLALACIAAGALQAAAGPPPAFDLAPARGLAPARPPSPPAPTASASARAQDARLELVPGIAFAWTDPATEGLVGFEVRDVTQGADRITGVGLPAKGLTVTGYTLDPPEARLLVRLRAATAGAHSVRRLVLERRYAPPLVVRAGDAEVLALPTVGGPWRLGTWTADDALGLYGAFALVNESASDITLRRLHYAPGRWGRGLVLIATGPPAGFQPWRDAVLRRMAPAFAAYLEGHGRPHHRPPRPVPPASLAFPLTRALAASRWQASDALDVTVAPGAAAYLAITPAAFSHFVDDHAIVSYPVVGFGDGDACCALQGIPAAIVHDARAPGSASRSAEGATR